MLKVKYLVFKVFNKILFLVCIFQMREVLMDMFRTSCRVRSNLFKKKLEETVGNNFTDNDCKKLLRVYTMDIYFIYIFLKNLANIHWTS